MAGVAVVRQTSVRSPVPCTARQKTREIIELVGRPETFDRKLGSGGEWGRVSRSLGVAMRPPEVFVRELSLEEGARLKSIWT
jgi:hypothetical protein